jgi:hypothetical protein
MSPDSFGPNSFAPDSFDAVDRALAGGLSALAPDVASGDEALATLRPRFERAQTRARVARVGGTVAALLLIGSVATFVAPRSQRTHVQVDSSAPDSGNRGRRVASRRPPRRQRRRRCARVRM